jgi:phosphoserine phosphatase RsbU/P
MPGPSDPTTRVADPALLTESAEDLYEHAPCGYLSYAPDGTIVKVNETLLEWTGFERDELVGRRRFSDLLTVGGRIYHETHLAPLLAMQGEVREIAVDIAAPDGRRLPVLLNAVAKRDEHGEVLVVRATVFDARDRREYERELLRARHEAEHAASRARVMAQTLQESFIPPAPPRIPGFDVAGAYRPAGNGDEVGGDFYDVFETGGGNWAVVLGDVCGKGAPAAVVTALARYTIRAAAIRARRPRHVLATLNDAMLRQEADRFCTAVYGRVQRDRRGLRLTVCCAGHPLPFRMTRDGHASALGRPGTLLGVYPEPTLHDTTVEVERGDVVVFFSDGVTEARRRRGDELFGEERLVALLATCHGADAATIATTLLDAVVDYQDGMTRDDVALVVLKRAD